MSSDQEPKLNVMDVSITPQAAVGVDNPTNQPQTVLAPELFDGFHNPSIKELEEYLRRFPPGYRFCPTDVELIEFYLKRKISNQPLPMSQILSANVYRHKPEFLSEVFQDYGETEWYFFTPRDRKYRNGSRPSRSTDGGYWKATGADKSINSQDEHIGFKKSLVFYRGKPTKGVKTNWIMHEFTVKDPPRNKRDSNDMKLDDWVLCRIKKKVEKSPRTNTELLDVDNENSILDDTENNQNVWNLDNAIIDPDPMAEVGELQQPLPNIGVMQEVVHQFSGNLHNQYQGALVGPSQYPSTLVNSTQMVQPIIDSSPNPLVDLRENVFEPSWNDYDSLEYLQDFDRQVEDNFSYNSFKWP